MYCIKRETIHPSWRTAPDCSECAGDEYCTQAAPGDDWVWDAALGAHRAPTTAEVLTEAKIAKLAAIDAEFVATASGVYDQETINDVAMDTPTKAYADAVKAHRHDMRIAQNVARAAVKAATTVEAVSAIEIQWGSLTPINPDAQEYQ